LAVPPLARTQDKKNVPPPVETKSDLAKLIKDLTDPSDKTAKAAMDGLEEIGLPAFFHLRAAFDKADENRAAAIVETIGRLRFLAIKTKNPAAEETIEKFLLTALGDRREGVIYRASWILTKGEPGCKKVVPDLIAILRDEK